MSFAGVLNVAVISLAALLFAPPHAVKSDQAPADFVTTVRTATEQFLDVRRAHDAHYEPFLGCVSGPQEGAMGVHFVNLALVGDGELDVNHPEALIYEPTDSGEARLVGVEYIVTVDDWHKHHRDLVGAPVLNGQTFHFNDSPNRFGLPAFYELHVWAWQQNPHGTFVDWNTLVSCDGAR